MTNIHPSAVVHPRAELGSDVVVGPFCVVESGAIVGDGCVLAARVTIKTSVTLGRNNEISENAVIGGRAQHVGNGLVGGKLIVGDNNRIRENVTIHTGFKPEDVTIVGNNNMFMCGSHVAHDCRVGSHVILVNDCKLAGHVTIHDRAFLSGAVGVHQYCRVGTLAMVGGHAKIVKDVPPYVTVDGSPAAVIGLNKIGLRRAGMTPSEISQLKDAYRTIYRRGLRWNEVLETLARDFTSGPTSRMLEFLQGGKRGFTAERRSPRTATTSGAPTLRLHVEDGDVDARDAA